MELYRVKITDMLTNVSRIVRRNHKRKKSEINGRNDKPYSNQE